MFINQILTTKETASYLRINPQVLEKYLRGGAIPARKVGRQWRISKLALDLWLAPSLAEILPRLFLWQEIFSAGDKIGERVTLSDEKILRMVKTLRNKRDFIIKSRS